ncbi:MAG: hypothetical protein AAGK47_00695 [Bacteroidota bacterium]
MTHAREIMSMRLPFYSDTIALRYHSNMNFDTRLNTKEQVMVQYFRNLESTDYQVLLRDLQAQQQRYQLNDYLMYDLMRAAVQQIYARQSELRRTLTCWFLLSKAGFDTRLTYLRQNAYLYVQTEDELFEIPMIEEKGHTYVNLTSIHTNESPLTELYMLNFVANQSGRSFRFYLDQLPKLRAQVVTQDVRFKNGHYDYQFTIKTDRTIADIMEKYPFFAEDRYLEAPLSQTLEASLLPQLREQTAQMSEYRAVQFLAAFTRSAFQYKEDKYHFGHSKPMIPDELFHYDYSDCEDRAALFYALVKRLLNLPMIALAYSDHLTVAVHLRDIHDGNSISHSGKKYYICDPTGPSNSNQIGRPPEGYERQKFEIISAYR